MRKLKIGIVGVGMVGKEVKKWFKESGWKKGKDLFCYDIDPKKPGLKDDVGRADVIFICVPTPSGPDGSCNTEIVESAVSKFKNSDKIIVIKSTVEPETVRTLSDKYNIAVLFNPEFLTEKQAWLDFIKPDRQIVGFTERSREYAKLVLDLLPRGIFSSPGVVGTYDFVQTESTEAELAKYFGNTFGALKVAFANVANIFCESVGADYESVRKIISADARIGDAWMNVSHGAYRGFGGYCFPKDIRAIIAYGRKLAKKIRKKDKKQSELLDAAIDYMQAAYAFNERLLESQGLTVEEVSGHIGEGVKVNKS